VRNPLHRVDADTMRGGDHAHARPILPAQIGLDCALDVGIYLGPAELLALIPGPPKACAHPLLDHRPLELGEHAHHLEQGLAGRRRGVETLLVQEQVQPVDTPGHDDIVLTARGSLAEGIELRTLVPAFGTADAMITVDLRNLATHPVSDGALPAGGCVLHSSVYVIGRQLRSCVACCRAQQLAKAKTREERERALLSLKICDPACGSGHFMLAAARRLGRELARVRSEEVEPNPSDHRHAIRDVIRRCIYTRSTKTHSRLICAKWRYGLRGTNRAYHSRSWTITSNVATA
jgi:hypothetical protein